ncbi:MAG: polyphosphate kinase 1 [Bacteroidetes bacterium]|nr:polyphosphate kinase 1 [Bacteroidota bacterium]MBU1719906.1 polyphosphate kinase 1 [Bacteroidota bacterium]
MKQENHFTNREISWLHFNERVLQEAADDRNPIIERLKFLGIFSNNMDEFFRVRVATLSRMVKYNTRPPYEFLSGSPKTILTEINDFIQQLRTQFDSIYQELIQLLAEYNVLVINEKQVSAEEGVFIREYFSEKVRPHLFPILLSNLHNCRNLRDKFVYFAVHLYNKKTPQKDEIALMELPTDMIPRFVELPTSEGVHKIILLDDVIRYCMKDMFARFEYNAQAAYTIKFTRDAELDLDSDISMSFLEIMEKSVKQRQKGSPVRFIYDKAIPETVLKRIERKLELKGADNVVASGRYHNFKDFIFFPKIGPSELWDSSNPPLEHKHLNKPGSYFELLRKRDVMLHFPYQSFHHIIDLIREASLDTRVISIKMTLYRLAKKSNVINALISAARNGKNVTVFMEIQARFDESANIKWSQKLQEEGIKVIHSVPGLKVHSKLLLITRKESRRIMYYANISTGNYNEDTAKIYADDALLTADQKITREVIKVFDLFENNYKNETFRHLLVSPTHMRRRFYRLIQNEVKFAKAGKPAFITMKLNNLVDPDLARKLLDAGRAGVKIRLIVRGICVIKAGISGFSENIEAYSIVDRFLEHSRVFVFHNGGDEKIFISSADFMTRNLDRRIEVAVSIYSPEIRKELKEMLDIQWHDNVKSRSISEEINTYRILPDQPLTRSQDDIYKFLKKKMS